MSSAQLSRTAHLQDHRLSGPTATDMEGIEEALPRSFGNIPLGSDVQRDSLSKEELASSIDQSLSKNLPLSGTPGRNNLSSSNEMSSVVSRPRPHPPYSENRMSSSNSRQSLDWSNCPDDRILCDNCDEWITTKDADGNDTGSWAKHLTSCPYVIDRSPSIGEDASTSISVTPAPTADSNEPRDTNSAFRRRKVKHYESERLALLEKDSQVEEVEEYRVLCGFCEKWIDLRKDRPYCPIAWTAHKLQCVNRRQKSGSIVKKVKREQLTSLVAYDEPSSSAVQARRTEEERMRFLQSDPHATNVEPHRILCAICRRWIQLRKNSTYCTAPWVQHIRKCAIKHGIPRSNNGGYVDEDGEDEIESEDETSRPRVDPIQSPPKRGRGRPKKRKLGEPIKDGQQSFALRPVSGVSTNNQRRRGRSSASPRPVRTPSPPPAHPYAHDVYWYPALPPMSSYYPLYAGSQYNDSDDSYSLYFHSQPPQPPAGQGRGRTKPPKHLNSSGTSNAAVWHGGPSPPSGLPSGAGKSSPGPDPASPQSGRAWVVWRLKDYSTNTCPMDPGVVPDHHTAASSEASGSGRGSEPLPMFRSGTWPHLLDPEDATQQNLSPYVHPDVGLENGNAPSARPTQLPPPPPPPPPPPQQQQEDPAMFTFNSSAHIPMRKSDAHAPQPPAPPLDPNLDPRLMKMPVPAAVPPPAPQGADLYSPESRLAFTFEAIAFLFRTSFQGADDMSLEPLMTFMNRTIPPENRYDEEEVRGHVTVLGERKQIVSTGLGGVLLSASPTAPSRIV